MLQTMTLCPYWTHITSLSHLHYIGNLDLKAVGLLIVLPCLSFSSTE